MKTFSTATYASLLSGLGLLLSLSACQGDKEVSTGAQAREQINTAKVQLLVSRLDKKGITEQEGDDFLREYKSLNAKELDLYNQLDGESTKKMYQDQPAALGEIDRVLAYRKSLVQQSLQKFGKPYNQLNPAQLDALFGEEAPNRPAARTAEEVTCPNWFPNVDNFYQSFAPESGFLFANWGTVDANNQNDCDCWIFYNVTGVTYPNLYRALYPVDTRALNLLSLFGNTLSARVEPTNNNLRSIIFGRNRSFAVYFFPCFEAKGGLKLTNR